MRGGNVIDVTSRDITVEVQHRRALAALAHLEAQRQERIRQTGRKIARRSRSTSRSSSSSESAASSSRSSPDG